LGQMTDYEKLMREDVQTPPINEQLIVELYSK